jgi:hypothetical protein
MPGETYDGPSIQILKSLPPELYKTIPFAQPPPGVEAKFDHPPTRVPVILGVSIAYLVIATLCLGTRTYAKAFIVKKWRWDDSESNLTALMSCDEHRLTPDSLSTCDIGICERPVPTSTPSSRVLTSICRCLVSHTSQALLLVLWDISELWPTC